MSFSQHSQAPEHAQVRLARIRPLCCQLAFRPLPEAQRASSSNPNQRPQSLLQRLQLASESPSEEGIETFEAACDQKDSVMHEQHDDHKPLNA